MDSGRPSRLGPGTHATPAADASAAPYSLCVTPLSTECGLRLAGDIDISSTDLLDAALAAIPAADGDIRLDMTEVDFIDVVGTGSLVRAAARLDGGRRLILHRPPPVLLIVLGLFPEADGRVGVLAR